MAVLLKRFLENTLLELYQNNPNIRYKVSQFLLDNNWFNIKINHDDFSISKPDALTLKERIVDFLTEENGFERLKGIFYNKFPETFNAFQKFIIESKIDEASQFYLQDFLAYHLTKDLFLYSDFEVENLMENATEVLTKTHGMKLTQFIKWLLEKGITKYRKSYEMTKRYTLEDKNGAYELDEYLELMYYLFNDDYIEKNDMYYQAAVSKDYVDT